MIGFDKMRPQQMKIWMLAMVMLAWAARLYRLDAKSLWFDEIITVVLARASWYDGLLGLLGQGIQLTPLFHWVTKLWLVVGDSEWLLRFPALCISVLIVPLMFRLGRFYFRSAIGFIAAFIFAIAPYQVWYGQEIKLYTLLVFASIGSMLAFGYLIRSRGRQGMWAMLAFNLLGFCAHYFMFLISTVQFLYILLTFGRTGKILRRWIVAQFVPVLALVPWWLFIINQQHFAVGIGWVPRPRWFDPFLTLWDFSFGYGGNESALTILGLVVLAGGLSLGLWRAWRKSRWGRLLALWLFFPPLITFALSFYRLSFYVDRYLLIISPVLAMVTAYGLWQVRPWLRGVLFSLFIGASLLGLWQLYYDPVHLNKDDWRALAQTVDAQAAPGDIVIACNDGDALAFAYYNPRHTLNTADIIIRMQVTSTINAATHNAWIINKHYRPPIHILNPALPPVLDPALLAADAAAWEKDHLQEAVTVAGLSAYRYALTTDPHFLPEITAWHCDSDKFWRDRLFTQ